MATGGFELDVPDTPANAAAFGYSGGEDRSAFPKVRVVTIGEWLAREGGRADRPGRREEQR
jgi:hypothetical protein